MSAEPVADLPEAPEMPDVPAVPGWMFPGQNGFIASDLDRMPSLPPHSELIDGGLVLVSPQKDRHMRLVRQLDNALEATAPAEWSTVREMSIVLSDRQRPVPDVAVIDAGVVDGEATWYPASAVLLAVEVVSPESEVRDRERKPQLYAQAGIRHFWRVEPQGEQTVVYVYELDPATRTYAPTGIFHNRLKLEIPFPIDIDLS